MDTTICAIQAAMRRETRHGSSPVVGPSFCHGPRKSASRHARMVRRFSANRGGVRREMRGFLEPSVPRSNRRCRQPLVVALGEPIPTRTAGHDADMPDICWKLAKRDMLGDLVQESRLCGTGRVEAKVCLSAARQSENVDLPGSGSLGLRRGFGFGAPREALCWEPGTRETEDRPQEKLGSSKLRRRKIISTEA